jgi:(p)ppGpp synthase/HD superfamily hydrolase
MPSQNDRIERIKTITNQSQVKRAIKFSKEEHSKAGTEYDGQCYSVHLHMCADTFGCFFPLIEEKSNTELENILTAIYLHDILEDCPIHYSKIVEEFNVPVADMVYNVTDELGKNRKERAIKTYPKIACCPNSLFVKLCDRIANTEYSKKTNSGMLNLYRNEWKSFMENLLIPSRMSGPYRPMIIYLESLIK